MKPLNRKQREHVAALTKRFEYVTHSRPERPSDPDYIPGEAQALAWVIAVLAGVETPPEVRIEMLEREIRGLKANVGNLQKWVDEFEEEEVAAS